MFSLFQDHVVINLIGLEKTSRPGNVRGYLQIQKFSDDPSLCPMDALIEYFNRVRYSENVLFSILKIYSFRPSLSVVTGHHSLCLTKLHTNQLALKHCRGGLQIYFRWLVWMSPSSSHTLPGQLLLTFTANLSIVYKFVGWQTGAPPVEFMKNFIGNICEDDVYPFIIC